MEERSIEKKQEAEVVTTAYFLEKNIDQLKQEQRELNARRPREPAAPQRPRRREAKITPIPYPPVDGTVKFPMIFLKGFLICCALAVIGSLFPRLSFILPIAYIGNVFWWLMIGWFFARKKIQRTREERIRTSSEYQIQCREIDEENRKNQERLDEEMEAKYLADCEQYNIALQKHQDDIRRYQEEILPAWSEEAEVLQTALKDAQTALQELYDRRVIPAQYRNIPALMYLSTFIATSNYDLKFAIQRYDEYVGQCQRRLNNDLAAAQLVVMREVSQNQQYNAWLTGQTNEILERGNATLHSINSWQKADLAIRTYWRFKDRREQRARR